MNLIVCIGNTHTQAAVGGKALRRIACFLSRPGGYPKSLRMLSSKLSLKKVDGLGIVSVVPSLNAHWRTFAEALGIDAVISLNPSNAVLCEGQKSTKLLIRYSPKSSLGADRIATALGAIAQYPEKNRIVVDVGSAVTVNLISRHCEFLGGMIFPGLALCLKTLSSGTGLLPEVKQGALPKIMGQTTEACIRSGVLHQVAGGIRACVDSMKARLKDSACITVVTGGGYPFIKNLLRFSHAYEKNLLLIGAGAWLDAMMKFNRRACARNRGRALKK